jgi:hypothetical protein
MNQVFGDPRTYECPIYRLRCDLGPRDADQIENTIEAIQHVKDCSRATAVVTMFEMGVISSDEACSLIGLPVTGLPYASQTPYAPRWTSFKEEEP